MSHSRSRVIFDPMAFYEHRRSGITRYLAELIAQFRGDPALGIDALTPYRHVTSEHLVASFPREYRFIPLPRTIRTTVLRRLNRRRAREMPETDLVHHSLYDPDSWSAWRAPLHASTVYDFTIELFPDLFPTMGSHLATKRQFLDRCDVLLCISETTRCDLYRLHPNLDKPVAVTPLGVSPAFFDPQPRRIDRLPERYVLYVGNRLAHKNVDLLLRAFSLAARSDPSLHLVMSGKGQPSEDSRLRELGIEGRTLRMRVSDEALPWLYHEAAVFVLPSRYEGFGLPALEAMAAGAPCIVSDIPALLEVTDGASEVTPCDDPEALADLLRAVVGDESRATRLRETGRRRAGDFLWRRTAEATARAYDLVARTG